MKPGEIEDTRKMREGVKERKKERKEEGKLERKEGRERQKEKYTSCLGCVALALNSAKSVAAATGEVEWV